MTTKTGTIKPTSIKLEVLGVSSVKARKGEERGYLTAILYLASSVQVCALAELAGCLNGCLRTSGKGALDTVQTARERKTEALMTDRQQFLQAICRDIRKLQAHCERLGLTLVVRLNGTSDLPWELWPVEVDGVTHRNVFEAFSEVQFYDYTKIPTRKHAVGIGNYHLTFSYSAQPGFQPIVAKALQTYGTSINLAVVFVGELPETWQVPGEAQPRKVVDGDADDLRFLDEPGVVVGLKAKRVRGSVEGFAVA
jgi:hypothetical protein